MELSALFAGIDKARVAVIGDFCLDVYWTADMQKSRLSKETPHFPLPVTEERMSPGGAGNVACNIAALAPARLSLFGVLGRDWRGALLTELLRQTNADTSGLIEDETRMTNAYIKPLKKGISNIACEDPRLDFENYSVLSKQTEDRLIERLEGCDADVLCVCDQLEYGCVTPRLRAYVCSMGVKGKTVIVDSRDRAALFKNVIVKPNDREAAIATGVEDMRLAVRHLSEKNGRPAIITCGEAGCLVCENGLVTHVPARAVPPPIDICGAGDTFLAALALAYAAGETLINAAAFANTAASVTIGKLNTTGTATRAEIMNIWRQA